VSWVTCGIRETGLAVLTALRFLHRPKAEGVAFEPLLRNPKVGLAVQVCPWSSVRPFLFAHLPIVEVNVPPKKKSRPCHKLAVELVSRVPPCPSSKPENQTPIKKDCRLPPPSFNLIFLLTTIWHKVLFISLDPPTQ